MIEYNMSIRLEGALDIEYEITRRYTGRYFEEEIKGLADASGCSESRIRRIHMIGELTLVVNYTFQDNCISMNGLTLGDEVNLVCCNCEM